MKKSSIFRAPKAESKKFQDFWTFRRVNLGMFDANAEVASKIFRVFYSETAYDVITFKFQGGTFAPLLTPMDTMTNESRYDTDEQTSRAKTATD